MATPRQWADAFREQAREDLVAAQAAYEAAAYSSYCMLMQMVFEKLAKAVFARSGETVPRQHQVAERLAAVLRRTPGAVAILIGGDATLSTLLELESAQPAVVMAAIRSGNAAQYPQLEYPWENAATGNVEWPAMHLPLARRVADPKDRIAANLLRSARSFLLRMDEVFS